MSSMAALALIDPAAVRAQGLAIKDGDKIAFMGDSITQQGAGTTVGYVRLVISGLEANGLKATAIPAGISGHKSDQMLARLERDVISKKPDWMTLSCGVNDVWHGERGVPLELYKQNITQIVSKCQSAGIKVMILTATMIGEDQSNTNNQKLVAYNDFLRTLAKEKQCLLADLNQDMQGSVRQAPGASPRKGNLLTTDGVHMNPLGNQMMAAGILKAFGLNEAQRQKAQDFWYGIPRAAEIAGKVSLTLRQYEQLSVLAARQNRSATELINDQLNQVVESLLKSQTRDSR